jgi:hypothetical protein
MSKKLEFFDLNSWFSTKEKNLFVVDSFTTTGETTSYLHEFTSVTAIFNYILERYKDKSSSAKNRKIKVTLDEDKYIHVLQTTKYDTYTSYKLYKVFSGESNISRLKKMIYEADFKEKKEKKEEED